MWRAAQLVTRSARRGPVEVRGRVEAFSTMHRAHGLMAEITGEREARRVFRWGMVDALERCAPDRACPPCALLPECAGRAKRASGHIGVDDAIAMKRRADAQTWRSEMLCETPRRDDLVFPEFDRAVHVFDHDWPARVARPAVERAASVGDGPLVEAGILPRVSPAGEGFDPGLLWVCGMDFGFRAPTVILFAALDATGALRVVDERVAREATLQKHIDAMLACRWPRAAWVGVDPAGNQRSLQSGASDVAMLRRAGVAVRDRRFPVETGLRMLRARLSPASGSPTLFIHARCATLIESLERHHYRADRPESDAPVKDGSDHAVDALRYLVQNLDGVRAERVSWYL